MAFCRKKTSIQRRPGSRISSALINDSLETGFTIVKEFYSELMYPNLNA
jgi:hypothetical protein